MGVPYKGFRAPPVAGFRKAQLASACLREAPPCGAEAGAFLISLGKWFFSRPLNMKEGKNEDQSCCGKGEVRSV
jgi:hypothetical protein